MNTYTATGTVASVSGSVTSVWPFAQMLNVVSISSVSDCAVPVSTSHFAAELHRCQRR